MTAFARLTGPGSRGPWTVEIRSLNHRYFEFSLKLPSSLNSIENQIREIVQARMHRGKVTVSISQDAAADKLKGVSLDEPAANYYRAAIEKLRKRFKIRDDISLGDLLTLPGIFTVESGDQDSEKSWASLKKVLVKALDGAVKAKQAEGGRLAVDIRKRLHKISDAVKKIQTLAAGRTEIVFKRLSEKLAALLNEKEIDPERTWREAAFLAERSDVTEEIVRMRSHLELFESRLAGEAEVGRELDFLCQEMNREVNTMGSKAQLFEISTEVVFMKGELEKIREQIQNIE